MKPETALAKLDVASKMLAKISSAEDAKNVADMADAATTYAKKAKLGKGAVGHAVGIKLDAFRILGGFIAKMPKSKGGRPAKNRSRAKPVLTLADLNLDKGESAKAQKLFKMLPPIYAEYREQQVAIAKGIKIPTQSAIDADSDECYTPPEWPDRAREVMGAIDLDPFSCELANQFVKADRFYTEEDNALDQEWHGRIWYQPPYSGEIVDDAANKLVVEIEAGRVIECIGLTNTCSTSKWWQKLAALALVVCFPKHRINFYRPAGGDNVEQQKGNRADQTFFYFGTDRHRFEYVFGEHGVIGQLRGNLA